MSMNYVVRKKVDKSGDKEVVATTRRQKCFSRNR